MKLFRTLCVIGLTLCVTGSVFAGTQSVKISGDIAVRGILRQDYDLNHESAESAILGVPTATETLDDPQILETSPEQAYFMTTTELQVDADLTDNVSAVIRLFNQRDWNTRVRYDGSTAFGDSGNPDNVNLATPLYTANNEEFDIGIDLAYIELKEFLYSPLTLRLGRQDIWFGKGFVIGANQQDVQASINANEYTCVNSFDAIRATLDYDPWTIDVIYASLFEGDVGSLDDESVKGFNVGYIFDQYNAETEAYWFHKQDKGSVPARNIKQHNSVHCIGLRGSADPIEDWTVALEGAYQFGHFVGYRDQYEKRGRQAYAIDASAECRHFRDMFAWKPVIGTEYILYSGDDEERPTRHTTGLYQGWDVMYRGKFDTAYREFVGAYNFTHQSMLDQQADYSPERFNDLSTTNQHQVIAYGQLMPTDSLTLDGRVAFFWTQHKRAINEGVLGESANAQGIYGDSKRPSFLGTEIDLTLTWDYTEDVSFGVLAAWFIPGSFYVNQSDDTATDIVGTVSLSF